MANPEQTADKQTSWNEFLEKQIGSVPYGPDGTFLSLDFLPDKIGDEAEKIVEDPSWKMVGLRKYAQALVYGYPTDPEETTQFSRLRWTIDVYEGTWKKGKKTKKFNRLVCPRLEEIRPRMKLTYAMVKGYVESMPDCKDGFLQCIMNVKRPGEEEKEEE